MVINGVIENVWLSPFFSVYTTYNLRACESLREKFTDCDILTVASQYIYANIVFVRQNISAYNKNREVYDVNIRNKHKLKIPCYKVHGSLLGHIRYYNKIPKIILDMPFIKFKEHVKTVLMKKDYYTIDDYMKDKKDVLLDMGQIRIIIVK